MRMKTPNRHQVFLETGAAIAVALTCTSVSTAQELRSSDIMYPHASLGNPRAERSRLVDGLA